jgi:hypothetical protein
MKAEYSMRTISIATAARILDESADTLRGYRHGRLGDLGSVGTRSGRELELELRDLMLFALTSAFVRQNRPLETCAKLASTWLPTVDHLVAGRIGGDGRTVYAIEAVRADGTVERFVADGVDMLTQAMVELAGAASISVTNLSALVATIQTGWSIAVDGPESARASLAAALVGELADVQAAVLADFDRQAARIAPPKKERAPKERPYTFDPPTVTSNGTFTIAGDASPVAAGKSARKRRVHP